MVKRVFAVHGFTLNPSAYWFPWLKAKLEERGIFVSAPAMPNPNNPVMGEWVGTLASAVGKPDDQTYFIGHSLGCITILRYLESLDEEVTVGGVVFVAGFSEYLGIQPTKNFFETQIDWEKVNSHCKNFVMIASDNDPFVDIKYGNILKEKLNGKLLIQPGMKHFGVKELHVALNELLKMMEGREEVS